MATITHTDVYKSLRKIIRKAILSLAKIPIFYINSKILYVFKSPKDDTKYGIQYEIGRRFGILVHNDFIGLCRWPFKKYIYLNLLKHFGGKSKMPLSKLEFVKFLNISNSEFVLMNPIRFFWCMRIKNGTVLRRNWYCNELVRRVCCV